MKKTTCSALRLAERSKPPSPTRIPLALRGGTLDQITCSQSLLGRNEAADIFGKRVANTYLVVQVDVRNLSDDFQFLLHDVRLVYAEEAVAGREKRLVRGVSEKGQALDVRNLTVRIIQGSGSVLGGISALSFASTAFKDATNIYQGPFAGAIQSIFPDFTIGQLNRLNDMGFGVQTVVIPKRSSVAFVTFLPQQVFLNDTDRKLLKTSLLNPMQPKGSMLSIQQHLAVEISGAHVEEVQKTTPTLTTVAPAEVAPDDKVAFTLVGTNLDKVASLRISQPGSATDTTKQAGPTTDLRISLPSHDPKPGMTDRTDIVTILNTLKATAPAAGASTDYPVSLQTILGETIATTLKITVKSAPAAAPAAPPAPVPGATPTVTAAATTPGNATSVTIPKDGSSPTSVVLTGTNLNQIKSFTEPNEKTCPSTDLDKEVSLEIQPSTNGATTPTTLTVKMTVTSKAQAKAAGKVNVCALLLKDGTTTLKLALPKFEIKAAAVAPGE